MVCPSKSRTYKNDYDPNLLAATYSAFCRNFGDYNTEAVGEHNWNEEAIERMVKDLAAPWQDLRSTLQRTLEDNNRLIEDLMNWAIEYLGKVEGKHFPSDH
jgi:hypothetical protein